ncbi:MAG: putative sulfate exporter family transporter [Bdellovibrionales bacterium]|nr:putative sulfate exporter family transporter [Oligoflexia bacterium]
MDSKGLRAITIFYVLCALTTLLPWVSSGLALLVGLVFALVLGNPILSKTKKLTPNLLQISVMGLGAGMNLAVVGKTGMQGIVYTIIGIATAMLVGTLLGRILKTPKDTSLLISVGTAICGGSAIAAVAPVIRAKSHEVSVALGIIFILNALALFIFPAIGHHFALDEGQFGLWCALAIHDTSSVVGTTLQYGAHALEVGTTVKLARALWIIPMAFMVGMIRSRTESSQEVAAKGRKPWFILGFLIAAALVTGFPELQPIGHRVEAVAKHLMVLTLFLIGSSLTRNTLKSVGFKPFIQGVLLWILVAGSSLGAICLGWVHL